jgi:hypothetical protein
MIDFIFVSYPDPKINAARRSVCRYIYIHGWDVYIHIIYIFIFLYLYGILILRLMLLEGQYAGIFIYMGGMCTYVLYIYIYIIFVWYPDTKINAARRSVCRMPVF